MLQTVDRFGSRDRDFMFFCFMILMLFSFVSCASVHLFGFTISQVLGLTRNNLLPQILHLHYTGARFYSYY